jgi:hypothetical protein
MDYFNFVMVGSGHRVKVLDGRKAQGGRFVLRVRSERLLVDATLVGCARGFCHGRVKLLRNTCS